MVSSLREAHCQKIGGHFSVFKVSSSSIYSVKVQVQYTGGSVHLVQIQVLVQFIYFKFISNSVYIQIHSIQIHSVQVHLVQIHSVQVEYTGRPVYSVHIQVLVQFNQFKFSSISNSFSSNSLSLSSLYGTCFAHGTSVRHQPRADT